MDAPIHDPDLRGKVLAQDPPAGARVVGGTWIGVAVGADHIDGAPPETSTR